ARLGLPVLHRSRRAPRRSQGAAGARGARRGVRVRQGPRLLSAGRSTRRDVSKELVSAAIAQIAPYEPGKSVEELERELGRSWGPGGAIKLASNENPIGPSPLAVAAAQAALGQLNRYPDGGSLLLRRKLAARLGVDERQVVMGSGSSELIDLLAAV